MHQPSIVIIGAGGIVQDAHLPAYRQAGLSVAGIYDLDAKKAKEVAGRFGIPKVCRDLPELITLAQSTQSVYDVALPANQLLKVLPQLPPEIGVLIQKPMGENLQEAQKILNLAREKGWVAGINFQLRHAAYVQAAKRLIEAGEIGQLHDIDVRLNVHTPWDLWEFLYDLPRVEILYHSIHYLDLIRYFLGDPLVVYAKTTRHPNMKALAATRSNIILDYGDWIRANINTNHGHDFGDRHQESYFKFEGTHGTIKIRVGVYLDYPQGKPDDFEYINRKEDNEWKTLELTGSWFPDAFAGPMLALMRKMEEPDFHFINDVEDAVRTMAVVEAAYQSSEKGGVIPEIS